jgi:predicted lipoprotein with Yx(FWY)xxD motif
MRLGPRRMVALTGLLVGTVLLTACGSSPSQPSTGGPGSTPTVRVEQVANVGMVLVDSRGFTLYYLKGETATSIHCTGACASTWPPLTIPSGEQPTAGPSVPGKLATIQRPDGSLQVTYEGAPLYTFTGDSGPGQAAGQGVENFFVVSPTGAIGNSGSSPGSSTGYGYYGS